jgi:hypothetical protein
LFLFCSAQYLALNRENSSLEFENRLKGEFEVLEALYSLDSKTGCAEILETK